VPKIIKTHDFRFAAVVHEDVPRTLDRYIADTFGTAEARCLKSLGIGNIELPEVHVFSGCWHAKSPRNFAGISVGEPTELHLCDDLAEQLPSRIRGILWHEVGHVLCYVHGLPTTWTHKRGIGMDEEQLADLATELLCGVVIYYDEEMVQRAGPGRSKNWIRPRPKGLR
jgi:hypothetical protein